MDWRQPWLWPRHFQYALFVASGFFGALLLSPWWVHSWNAWSDVTQAQAKLLAQQQATLTLREQTAQLEQASNQRPTPFADAAVLSQLAQQEGLQLAQIGMDKPQQNAALNVL